MFTRAAVRRASPPTDGVGNHTVLDMSDSPNEVDTTHVSADGKDGHQELLKVISSFESGLTALNSQVEYLNHSTQLNSVVEEKLLH